jgi:hypothetical protein
MPPESHLDIYGNAAGMRPNPGLIRSEDDPDLPGKRALLVAGILTVKSSPVACDERTVDDPAADRYSAYHAMRFLRGSQWHVGIDERHHRRPRLHLIRHTVTLGEIIHED